LKKVKKVFVFGMFCLFVLVFSGCVSTPVTDESVASGRHFRNHIFKYVDPSIPFEEHSFLINLTNDASFGITRINNDRFGFLNGTVVILPPGSYSLRFEYHNISGNEAATTSRFNFLPGHYYYYHGAVNSLTKEVWFMIGDLNSVLEVQVGRGNDVSPRAVIEGIKASIARERK